LAKTRTDQIALARELYARGLTLEEIGEAVGVAASSVSRWRSKDPESWDGLRTRTEQHSGPQLVRSLERLLSETLARDTKDVVGQADSIAKITRAIEVLSGRYEDVDLVLDVLMGFAKWAGQNLSDENLNVTRNALDRYLVEVIRERGGRRR